MNEEKDFAMPNITDSQTLQLDDEMLLASEEAGLEQEPSQETKAQTQTKESLERAEKRKQIIAQFKKHEQEIYKSYEIGKLDVKKITQEQTLVINKINDALASVTVDEIEIETLDNEREAQELKLESLESESKETYANFKNTDAFPLHVFPENIQKYMKDIVNSIATEVPVNYPASLVFPAAGSLMTETMCKVSTTYEVIPNFMVGLVGSSGHAKSPCMKNVLRLLDLQQQEYDNEYRTLLEQYHKDEEETEDKPKRRSLKKAKENTECSEGSEEPVVATRKKKPTPPEQKLTTANDVTREAVIAKLLAAKGLCLHFDELSAFQGGFNQYKSGKSGNDKETYMTLLDGGRYTATRKTKGRGAIEISETIQAPRLSIMGGVTSDKLRLLINNDFSDGFEERYLLVADYNPLRAKESFYDADMDNLLDCQKLFMRIKKLSGTMTLSPEARELYCKYTNRLINRVNEIKDLNVHIEGLTVKMGSTVIRIAMVLNALNEKGMVIDLATMQDAVLVAEFFRKHTIGVYLSLQPPALAAKAKKVLSWAEKKNITILSVRNICRFGVASLALAKDTREVFEELVSRELAIWTKFGKEIKIL